MSNDLTNGNLIDKRFFNDKHISFVLNHLNDNNDEQIEANNFLRIAGIFWCIITLETLSGSHDHYKNKIITYIKECQCQKSGGFYEYRGDCMVNLLSTMYAIKILIIYDALNEIDVEGVVEYVKGLQQSDGSFCGAEWHDDGIHYSYYAVTILTLLNRMNEIKLRLASSYVLRFTRNEENFDIGDLEKLYMNINSCVGYFSIVKRLKVLKNIQFTTMLSDSKMCVDDKNSKQKRFVNSSIRWLQISTLRVLGRLSLLKTRKLRFYLYKCQDHDIGGVAHRPHTIPEIMSTFYSIISLALLGRKPLLKRVHPVFIMPDHILKKLNIKSQILRSET